MEEAEVDSVEQEVATHEAETQEAPQEEQQQPVDDHQERNWRAARQKMAELERQNREKDDLLRKALELREGNQTPKQVIEEPEEPDDEYIPKGRVKSLARKQMEPLEKKIQELEQHLEAQRQRELFQTLKSKYRDFDEIVNPETIALLEEKDPELAQTIVEIKDPYKMGIQTYKYIKAFGIAEDVPEKRRSKEAEKKLEKNAKTVQSPLAYDKRPMAQAFRMTESEKSKLWEEMNHYGSMASTAPPLS